MTKEKFMAYEGVRTSGVTNMFAVNVVGELSGLEREDILDIMKNYSKYADQFLKEDITADEMADNERQKEESELLKYESQRERDHGYN